MVELPCSERRVPDSPLAQRTTKPQPTLKFHVASDLFVGPLGWYFVGSVWTLLESF